MNVRIHFNNNPWKRNIIIINGIAGVNNGTEYTETFVENKYIDKQPETRPGAQAYSDQLINTAIIPGGYTSMKYKNSMMCFRNCKWCCF